MPAGHPSPIGSGPCTTQRSTPFAADDIFLSRRGGRSAIGNGGRREAQRASRGGRRVRGDAHVNVNAHDHGGHFIPWENPDAWVSDLRRTFHGRRP